jgi:putative ABC transport system substrate-binding protein
VPEGAGTYALDPKGHTPIVSPVLMDPVERGFAVSLSRPGGNITGFTLMHTELNGKRLELLHTAFPHITTGSALVNPASESHKLAFEQTEMAARSIGLGNAAGSRPKASRPCARCVRRSFLVPTR